LLAREDELALALDLWIEGEARITPEYPDITAKLKFVSHGIDSTNVIDEETHAHGGRSIRIGGGDDAPPGGLAHRVGSRRSIIDSRASGGRIGFRWLASAALRGSGRTKREEAGEHT
jgi:hypothetical protein